MDAPRFSIVTASGFLAALRAAGPREVIVYWVGQTGAGLSLDVPHDLFPAARGAAWLGYCHLVQRRFEDSEVFEYLAIRTARRVQGEITADYLVRVARRDGSLEGAA